MTTRRDFLKMLAGAVASTALPLAQIESLVKQWDLTGVVEFQTFDVTDTMHIRDVGVIVRNCLFRGHRVLGKKPILQIEQGASDTLLANCSFICQHEGYAIQCGGDSTSIVGGNFRFPTVL